MFVALNVEHALKALVAGVDDAGAVVLETGVAAEAARRGQGDGGVALGQRRNGQHKGKQAKKQFFHGGTSLG